MANGWYGIKITVGTAQKYLMFSANKAVYDSLATNLGLEKIETPAEIGKGIQCRASKFANRLGIKYATGSTTGVKSRNAKVWVAPEKYEECFGGSLVGEKYNTKDITGVFQPLDSGRS